MSRNANKKPVGFATHIIAGGIAGGCEAVSGVERAHMPWIAHRRRATASMPTSGHHQGPNAAVEIRTGTGCKLSLQKNWDETF